MNNEQKPNEKMTGCTTAGTENQFSEKECNDIWKRNCPECGKELLYCSKSNKKRADEKNGKCPSCSSMGRNKKYFEYSRICPFCLKKIIYKRRDGR